MAKKDKKARHTFNYELMKNGKFPEDKIKSAGKQMRTVWSISTPTPDEKKIGETPNTKTNCIIIKNYSCIYKRK